jgi:hypothetical protein
MAAVLVGCGGGGDAGSNNTSPQPQAVNVAGTTVVTYAVGGSTTLASLTYSNNQGGTVQEKVSLPWSKQYTMKQGDFLYISAQNENASGSVVTEIRVNGVSFKSTTSTGAYVIATASGSCC